MPALVSGQTWARRLATVLDTSEVLVQARVPTNRLAAMQDALTAAADTPVARVMSPSFPGLSFPTKDAWLNQQTEALTGDVPVRLRVLNPKGLLRVGMSVEVELFGQAIVGVAVPEKALAVNEDGKYVVTLIKDGKAVPRVVELNGDGQAEVRAGGWVRIVKGLAAGDLVAVEGGYGLPEGTPVNAEPPSEAPSDKR